VCLFLINDIAFALDLKNSASNSTLAPTSKFNPIVNIRWDDTDEKYVITENTDEINNLKSTDSFGDDVSFIYLNLLIGQFLYRLTELSTAGVSARGIDSELENLKRYRLQKFIEAIKRDLPHVDFNRFLFKKMKWDNNAICLPYERKDDRSTVQILRFNLPESLTSTIQNKTTASIDKLHKVESPVGIDGVKVILEDPMDEPAAQLQEHLFVDYSAEQLASLLRYTMDGGITIQISKGCSKACLICGVDGSAKKIEHMPFETVCDLLKFLKSKGIKKVNLYFDNEPMEYFDKTAQKDLADVLVEVNRLGLKTIITTHGWPVNNERAKEAARKIAALPFNVEINISTHAYHPSVINAPTVEEAKKAMEKHIKYYDEVIATLLPKHPKVRVLRTSINDIEAGRTIPQEIEAEKILSEHIYEKWHNKVAEIVPTGVVWIGRAFDILENFNLPQRNRLTGASLVGEQPVLSLSPDGTIEFIYADQQIKRFEKVESIFADSKDKEFKLFVMILKSILKTYSEKIGSKASHIDDAENIYSILSKKEIESLRAYGLDVTLPDLDWQGGQTRAGLSYNTLAYFHDFFNIAFSKETISQVMSGDISDESLASLFARIKEFYIPIELDAAAITSDLEDVNSVLDQNYRLIWNFSKKVKPDPRNSIKRVRVGSYLATRHTDAANFKELIDELSKRGKLSALDIGTGQGEFCFNLPEMYKDKFGNIVGIDMMSGSTVSSEVDGVKINIQRSMPLEQFAKDEKYHHSFDVIFLNNPFTDIWLSCKDALPKLLKPGGKVVVTAHWAMFMTSQYQGFEDRSVVARYLNDYAEKFMTPLGLEISVIDNIDGYPKTGYQNVPGVIVAKYQEKNAPASDAQVPEGMIVVDKETGRIKFGSGPFIEPKCELWAVRHGETYSNKRGAFQGFVDGPDNQLNETGKMQANKAAKDLFRQLESKIRAGEKIVVLTSELKRAKDTAQAFIDLVKKETGVIIKPIPEKLLNEMYYSVWENKSEAELDARQNELVERYRKRLDATVRAPGGQNFIDMIASGRNFLEMLNKKYEGRTVVAFGHGTQSGGVRVAMGDKTLLDDAGQINWRAKMLPNASPVLLHRMPPMPVPADVVEKLQKYGQAHLLDGWDRLSAGEKENLLKDIEAVDWDELSRLWDALVVRGEKPQLDLNGFKQIAPITGKRQEAVKTGEEVLRWGAGEGRAKFAGIIVAGGTGSSLKYEHAKGMLPATPISGMSLYNALIAKNSAAAQARGHQNIYPLVFMVSAQTQDETLKYLMTSSFWRHISDRVLFVRQRELPGVLRGSGKSFLKSKDHINIGGTGHGDALDYVLNPDAHAIGFYWDKSMKRFVEDDAVSWLKRFGVEYVQYMNVDNLLVPFADAAFTGEHVLSRDISKERMGRAHISLGMVRKTQWNEERRTYTDRLGNVIMVGGQKESLDYGDSPAQVNASPYGDPSIRLITVDSLSGSIPIEYSIQGKTDIDENGAEQEIYKFERSSGNKKRYGIEMGYEPENVFAAIKTRADVESAKKQQSDHWKSLIRLAMPDLLIPESTLIELPWEADLLTPGDLSAKLDVIDFKSAVKPNMGILVKPGFSELIPVPLPLSAIPPVNIAKLKCKMKPGEIFALKEKDGSLTLYSFSQYENAATGRDIYSIKIKARNLGSGEYERLKINDMPESLDADEYMPPNYEDNIVDKLNNYPPHPHIAPCRVLLTADNQTLTSYRYLYNLVSFDHLDLKARVDLALDITSAVRHLHSHGIVHGDIAARNVLVEYSNGKAHAYLFDFDHSRYGFEFAGNAYKDICYGLPRLLDSEKEWSDNESVYLSGFYAALSEIGVEHLTLDDVEKGLIKLRDEIANDEKNLEKQGYQRAYHIASVDNIPLILKYGFYGRIDPKKPGQFILANHLSVGKFLNYQLIDTITRKDKKPFVLVFKAPARFFNQEMPAAASLSKDSYAKTLPHPLIEELASRAARAEGIKAGDLDEEFKSAFAQRSLGHLPALFIDYEETVKENRRLFPEEAADDPEFRRLLEEMSLDTDAIDEINPVEIPQNKPVVAMFDVHGTLLQPNWKEVFERTYRVLTGKRITKDWIRENIWKKNDAQIVEALARESNKSVEYVEGKLDEMRETIWSSEVAPVVPGALKFVKALHKRGVPIYIVSRSYTRHVKKQLKDAGFLEYIPDEHVIGRENKKDKNYNRADVIRSIAAHYPDHTVAYFDDWTEVTDQIRDFAVSFGVAQGAGEEFEYNYGEIKKADPNYILRRKYDYKKLDKLLTVPAPVQLKKYVKSRDDGLSKWEDDGGTLERFVPDADAERNAAIDLRDAIIKETTDMNKEKFIVALGTRWIPGYTKGSKPRELHELIVSMRKFCQERGMPFIDKDDDELLGEITELRKQKEYVNAKVIVLAGNDAIEKELASLQNAALFGVDKTNLVDDSYIHIVEMMKVAMESAITGQAPKNSPFLPIAKRGNFWVFIPNADRVPNGDMLRRLYEVQRFA